MRIDTDTPIRIVADGGTSTADLEMVDVLFETTLRGLENQFRGGFTCDTQPVIFTDPKEARAYAEKRMEAWRRHRKEVMAIEAREKEERERYLAEIEKMP